MADITQYNQFVFPMNKFLLQRPALHKVCKVLGSQPSQSLSLSQDNRYTYHMYCGSGLKLDP